MTVPEESLRSQIDNEAARLARLEGDVEADKARLRELRALLPTLEPPASDAPLLLPKGPSVREKACIRASRT
jgi:hypothetical protein